MNVATELESPQTRSAATGRMKAPVYHGPGKSAAVRHVITASVGREAPTGDPGCNRRDRPDHDLDHLRH
jgi:hypothetical protein